MTKNLMRLLEPSQQKALEAKAKKVRLKRELERSQTQFTKFFFRTRGEVFIPADHHDKIEDVLHKLENRELYNEAGELCQLVVINIFPRAGKTQFCVIDWMARCIARNSKARFIHLSYSDELALDNSAKCRETVHSPEFQSMWPVRIKSDSDSKKKWYTTDGGGVYATAAGGAVTGFGAGSLADVAEHLEDEFAEFFDDSIEADDGLFYGAIVIDDPIKVDDAYHEKERTRVNKRLVGTVRSRRNSRNTPIVIIMQRLHDEDMSGFVLAGAMEEPVYHLNLPILVNGESIWPEKHTTKELLRMKAADSSVFNAQYMQDPAPDEGSFFKRSDFKRFRLGEEPTRLVKYAATDLAVSEDEGDWSEFGIAGFDLQENLWFIDWKSGQVTLDKSIDHILDLHIDHDPMLWAAEKGVIKKSVEPFLKLQMKKRRIYPTFEWLAATSSKAQNAKAFQGLSRQGKVYIPYGPWGDELIDQLVKFTGKADKQDDKVDVCGIFGRLLGQTYGPASYHDSIKKGDDYGGDDEDDYGTGTIPI